MTETPLTQEVIDGTGNGSEEKVGILAKAATHPVLTAGAILAGAGLAYATVKTIQSAAANQVNEEQVNDSRQIAE